MSSNPQIEKTNEPSNATPTVERNWAIVKLDTTIDWTDPDIPTRGQGRIMETYLVDLSSRTFCCEMTPSFELHATGNVEWTGTPDDDEHEETIYSYLYEGTVGGEPCIYVHCSEILGLPRIEPGESKVGLIKLGPDGTEGVVEDEEALEGMLEYYQGNPI